MIPAGHEVCKCTCGQMRTMEIDWIWKCSCGRSWQMVEDGDSYKLDYLGNRKEKP